MTYYTPPKWALAAELADAINADGLAGSLRATGGAYRDYQHAGAVEFWDGAEAVAAVLVGADRKADRVHFSAIAPPTGPGGDLAGSLAKRADFAGVRVYDRPETSASAARGVEAIARDLCKRLLPRAVVWTDDLRRLVIDAEGDASRRAEAVARIAAAFAVPVPRGTDGTVRPPSFAPGYGYVEVSHTGKSCTVSVRGVPVELAEEIARLWTAHDLTAGERNGTVPA